MTWRGVIVSAAIWALEVFGKDDPRAAGKMVNDACDLLDAIRTNPDAGAVLAKAEIVSDDLKPIIPSAAQFGADIRLAKTLNGFREAFSPPKGADHAPFI